MFLAFIFILIPSDFVDSTFHSNQSLEQLTEEIDKLNTTNNLYFLTILRNDEAVFEDTRQKFIRIEEITALPLNTIERLKNELINLDGLSEFGEIYGITIACLYNLLYIFASCVHINK